jgi:hypothetical protein
MWSSSLRWVTPSRIAAIAWVCCLFVLGDRVAVVAGEAMQGDPVYLCRFSGDCGRRNVIRVRCCRDSTDATAYRTPLYTCRAACLE